MIDKKALEKLAKNIKKHAFRRGYVSAFTLTAFPVETDEELVLHITRECDGLVYGNAEVGTLEAFEACVKALDGNVDFIFFDVNVPFEEIKNYGSYLLNLKKSVVLPYDDLEV